MAGIQPVIKKPDPTHEHMEEVKSLIRIHFGASENEIEEYMDQTNKEMCEFLHPGSHNDTLYIAKKMPFLETNPYLQQRLHTYTCWDDELIHSERFIFLFKVIKCRDLKQNVNKVHEKCNYSLVPFFWINNLYNNQVHYRYIKDIILPLISYEALKMNRDESKKCKLYDIVQRLQMVSNLFQQLITQSPVRRVTFSIGRALMKIKNSQGGVLKDCKIILNEVDLEDIKSNITEWAIEIVRILGEYSSRLGIYRELDSDESDEFERLVAYNTEHASQYNTLDTSGDYCTSSDTITSFSYIEDPSICENNADLINIENDSSETFQKFESNMSIQIHEAVIDPLDEINFWICFEETLKDMETQLKSDIITNTFELLETNRISVKNIYCFDEAKKSCNAIITSVENINILMAGFPLNDLKYSDTFDKLRNSIEKIIEHFKKLKFVTCYNSGMLTRFIISISIEITIVISKLITINVHEEDVFKLSYAIVGEWVNNLIALQENQRQATLGKVIQIDKINEYYNPLKHALVAIESIRVKYSILYNNAVPFINNEINGESKPVWSNLDSMYEQYANLVLAFSYEIGKRKIIGNELIETVNSLGEFIDSLQEYVLDWFRERITVSKNICDKISILKAVVCISVNINLSNMYGDILEEIIVELCAIYEELRIQYSEQETKAWEDPLLFYMDNTKYNKKLLYDMKVQGKIKVYLSKTNNIIQALEQCIGVVSSFYNSGKLQHLMLQLQQFDSNINTNEECDIEYDLEQNVIQVNDLEDIQISKVKVNYPFKHNIHNVFANVYLKEHTEDNDIVSIMDAGIEIHNVLKICAGICNLKTQYLNSRVPYGSILTVSKTNYDHMKHIISQGSATSWKQLLKTQFNDVICDCLTNYYEEEAFGLNIIEKFEDAISNLNKEIMMEKLKILLDEALDMYSSPNNESIILIDIHQVAMFYLNKWAKCVLKEWNKHFNTGNINEIIYNVKFSDTGKLNPIPTIATLRKQVYKSLYDTIKLPNDILYYINKMGNCHFESFFDFDDICIENIKIIEDTLSDLQFSVNQWQQNISEWKGHIIIEAMKNKNYVNVVNEFEIIVNQTHKLKSIQKIGPFNLHLPKQKFLAMVENCKMALVNDVYYDIMESTRELCEKFSQLANDMGMENTGKVAAKLTCGSGSFSNFANMTKHSRTNKNKTIISVDKIMSLDENVLCNCVSFISESDVFESKHIEIDEITVDVDCFINSYTDTISNYMNAMYVVINEYGSYKSLVNKLLLIEKVMMKYGFKMVNIKMIIKILEKIHSKAIDFRNSDHYHITKQRLQKLYDPLEKKVILINNQAREMGLSINLDSNYDAVYKSLCDFEIKCKILVDMYHNIFNTLSLFNEGPQSNENYDSQTMEYITSLKEEWMNSRETISIYKKMLSCDVTTTPFTEIEGIMLEIRKSILSGQVFCSKSCLQQMEKVEIFFKSELYYGLKDTSFKEKIILLCSSFEKNTLEPTRTIPCSLENLLGLYTNKNKSFMEILKSAKSNDAIRQSLSDLKDNWNKIRIDWIICHIEDQSFTRINNLEDICYFVNDSIISTQTVTSVGTGHALEDEVDLWINRLSCAKMSFQKWKIIEKQLTYLSNIFSSKEAQTQIAHGYAEYCRLASDDFRCLTSIVYLKHWVGKNVNVMLDCIVEKVKFIQKELNTFLNQQRFSFARLFFLSDEELFQIVGKCNIKNIHEYIFKVFPGVHTIDLKGENIHGIISKECEHLKFANCIETKHLSCIQIMKLLDEAIKDTLHCMLQGCVASLAEFYGFINDETEEKLFLWIDSFVSQILIVSLFLLWTRYMEAPNTDRKEFERFNSMIVVKLINGIYKSDYKIKYKLQNLVVYFIYHLNKLKSVPNCTMENYDWLKCIRYYLVDGSLKIQICNQTLNYGYEYLGGGRKLIITNLTEKCFVAMSESLNSQLIGNPQGPAGTGKTESIKALGDLCGYRVLVINCNEDFESVNISKIFSGLCQLGAWGIFDEFNRLKEGVLSEITEQMKTINHLLKTGKDFVRFLDRNVELHPNTGMFATINPNYSGRVTLPLNTRMLCRPCVMENVDIYEITKVGMTLSGFDDFSANAAKQICLFLKFSDIIFTNTYFDFGLRCVKGILKWVYEYLCFHIDLKVNNIPALVSAASIERFLVPRLASRQLEKFMCILKECCGVKTDTWCRNTLLNMYPSIQDSDSAFIKSFTHVCAERNIQLCDLLTTKVMEIYYLQKTTSGLIAFGPPGSGKSLTIEIAIHALQHLFNEKIVVVRFDPNALQKKHLYGHYHNNDWIDGLFSSILRKFSKSGNRIYIVLDGLIKSEWIEDLNSLLDDNLILTLANGNRIELTDNIKIIFETDSLENVTPATVSRCSIIQYETLAPVSECIQCFELVDPATYIQQHNLYTILLDKYCQFGTGGAIFSFINGFWGNLSQDEKHNLIEKSCTNYDCLDYDELEAELIKSYQSIEELMVTLLCNNTKCFQISCKIVSLKKTLSSMKDVIFETVYLTRGVDTSVVFDSIYKYANVQTTDEEYIISPMLNGREIKLIIIFKDIQTISSDSEVLPLLRQIAEYGYFYKLYKATWQIVFMRDIQFVLHMNPNESNIPQRIARQYPMIYIPESSDIKTVERNTEPWTLSNMTIPKDLYVTKSLIPCIDNIYNFLYTAKDSIYLLLVGETKSGKKLICSFLSKALDYEFIILEGTHLLDVLLEILKESGLGRKKHLIYVDWDMISLQAPLVLYKIKNILMNKNYSTFITEVILNDLYINNNQDESIESFRRCFYNNIQLNVAFILSSTDETFDTSLLNDGIVCKFPSLDHNYIHELLYQILDGDLVNNDAQSVYSTIINAFQFYKRYNIHHGYCISRVVNNAIIMRDMIRDGIKHEEGEINHLKLGIQKINGAKNEIINMDALLTETKKQLTIKKEQAQVQVKIMVEKQMEAEQSRMTAQAMAKKLQVECITLEERTRNINIQLENVKPLLKQAQDEVQSINRKSLDELKSMAHPPGLVKYTMETVVILLGNTDDIKITWDVARRVLKSPDFISKILNFNANDVDKKVHEIILQRMAHDQWDEIRISKASKAAGPLAKWVSSVIAASTVAISVQPLLNENKEIKTKHQENEISLQQQNVLIQQLEKELEDCKINYSSLVTETSRYEEEIESITAKLSRSKTVLSQVSKELCRWKDRVEEITAKKSLLLGRSFINSTMAALCGPLESSQRQELYDFICKGALKLYSDIDKKAIRQSWDDFLFEVNLKYHHCMILDGASFVIDDFVKENNRLVISACDSHFVTVLNSIKKCKGEIVIKDIYISSPSVKFIILKEYSNKTLLDFHIFLICTLKDIIESIKQETENDYLLYNIYKRAFVLNSKLSMHYFEAFCTRQIMKSVDLKLYMSNQDIEHQAQTAIQGIRKNEEELLQFLVTKSDILSQESLDYLEKYNEKRIEYELRLEECAQISRKYKKQVEGCQEYISLVCKVYKLISHVEQLDPFYATDPSLLFFAMERALEAKDTRTSFIHNIYKWIEQTLFIRHKLFWGASLLTILNKNDFKRIISSKDASIENVKCLVNTSLIKNAGRSTINCDVFTYYKLIVIITQGLQDPTGCIEGYAKKNGKVLCTYAVGSLGQLSIIEQGIKDAARQGYWILLKNAHILPMWFKVFESQIVDTLKETRVFVTWDSRMPISEAILKRHGKVIYEEPKGLKPLISFYYEEYKDIFDKNKGIFVQHLLFKSMLLHAIILCRQSYIPFGWSTRLDFDDNDLRLSLQATLDTSAIYTIAELGELYPDSKLFIEWYKRITSVYLSKITSQIDSCILGDLVHFTIMNTYPSGPSENIEDWIYNLPQLTTPSMVGLSDVLKGARQDPTMDQLKSFISNAGGYCTNDITSCKLEAKEVDLSHIVSNISNTVFKSILKKQRMICNDSSYFIQQCQVLADFAATNKSIQVDLSIFESPVTILDSMAFIVASFNDCNVHDLHLCGFIDNEIDCYQDYALASSQVIVTNLNLVGAQVTMGTMKTSDEAFEPVALVLRWVIARGEPVVFKYKIPVYNSREQFYYESCNVSNSSCRYCVLNISKDMIPVAANTLDRFGLAPPKFKPGFFIDYRKGEVGELRLLLRKMAMDIECLSCNDRKISGIAATMPDGTIPANIKRRREILKRLIACMTLGMDLSRLYAEVVMISHTNDPIQKKIIYLYLSTYSRDNPDLTVLTINTLLKDLDNLDPVIRSLAMRNICAMGTNLSNQYGKVAFTKKMFDPSDAVKRTAIIGGIRLYKAFAIEDPVCKDEFMHHLTMALKSNNVNVICDAMCAIAEVMNGSSTKIGLVKKSVVALINRLSKMNEWEQCAILQVLCTYNPVVDEMFNLMNLLDKRLNHASSAIFLATAKCFLHWTRHDNLLQCEVIKRIQPPMISLLVKSRHEILYILLLNTLLIIANAPSVNVDATKYKTPFSDNINVFFCLYDDPAYVKRVKLNILLALASETNALAIIHEFNEYISDSNYEIAARSIKALGVMAMEFPQHLELIISLLAAIFTSQVFHLVGAVLVTIKRLLRLYPDHCDELLEIVEGHRNIICDAGATLHYIWILGEYGAHLDHAPYTLEDFIEDNDQSDAIIAELLCASIKLFFSRAPEMYKALVKLLKRTIEDSQNLDLVNAAKFYHGILTTDVETARNIIFANAAPPTPNVDVMGKGDFYAPNDRWRELFNSIDLIENYKPCIPEQIFFPFEYHEKASSDIFTATHKVPDGSNVTVAIDSIQLEDSVKASLMPAPSDYDKHTASLVAELSYLDLVHPATILSEEFQNCWYQLQDPFVFSKRLETSANVDIDSLEMLLAKCCIITLASGKSDKATKLYQYAENSTGYALNE
ncbi:bifunctional P-loop containing nucleoside triphosphate hydrolase/Dynein heavy chain AAA lid domain superfamily/Dynein heavy chain [Babesia duncani]|uniref:Dynein heavy chain, cytoplasmic n=1 Tax=Babesia duncani TaxID=323732 RepID=A0AAD9PKY5_9APIC|nr:bifunctional P-loop containing nucleoside triphosphate hydrolase/Dynein heavy chain AAA lid domain superfamily/Dynein heavy chain [Babesia duncani]